MVFFAILVRLTLLGIRVHSLFCQQSPTTPRMEWSSRTEDRHAIPRPLASQLWFPDLTRIVGVGAGELS